VLFDSPNPYNVLGRDPQRSPLLLRLVVTQPEMHDTVLDDDVCRPDLAPILHRKPLLPLQLGEQLFSAATSASCVVSVTETTSVVMMSFTVRPCDLT
jgi:hypothetical protein